MSEPFAWQERIAVDQKVMAGKPCIRGTRVTVEALLDTLSVTGTLTDTAAQFPRISVDDVRAALAYASDILEQQSGDPVSAGG